MNEGVYPILLGTSILWGIVSSLLYLYAEEKRRDLATDMSQLLHDEKVTKDDLRRSVDHSDLQRWFDE